MIAWIPCETVLAFMNVSKCLSRVNLRVTSFHFMCLLETECDFFLETQTSLTRKTLRLVSLVYHTLMLKTLILVQLPSKAE